MAGARLVSVSAGVAAVLGPCQVRSGGFLSEHGQLMLVLTVGAVLCACMTCAALLYVRLFRDSRGHWDPRRPAYQQGERVGGLDLHSDADCKKGEAPLDDETAGEVYPLSSVHNTPKLRPRKDDNNV